MLKNGEKRNFIYVINTNQDSSSFFFLTENVSILIVMLALFFLQ